MNQIEYILSAMIVFQWFGYILLCSYILKTTKILGAVCEWIAKTEEAQTR